MFDFGDKKCDDCGNNLTDREKKNQCTDCKKRWCTKCLPIHATGKGYCKECETKNLEESNENSVDEETKDDDVTLKIVCNDNYGEYEFEMTRDNAKKKIKRIQEAITEGTHIIEIEEEYFVVRHITYFSISG